MATDAEMAALLQRMRTLSAADISVHEAVTTQPESEDVRLATAPGSANDALWSEMAKLGWGTVVLETLRPPPNPAATKVFIPNPEGRQGIASLVSAFQQERAQRIREKAERDAKLAVIYNELRRTVPAQLVERVRATGGGQADVVMMLLAIITATMEQFIVPDHRQRFLESLFEDAKKLLKLGT